MTDEYPTYTRHSPQARNHVVRGKIVTRHGKRKVILDRSPLPVLPVKSDAERKADVRNGVFTFGPPKAYGSGLKNTRKARR